MSEPLPELLDAKALRAELGVTRAAAEAIMRRLPVVQFEDLRKVYVRRSDVARLIQTRTSQRTRFRHDGSRIPSGADCGGFCDKAPPAARPHFEA